MKRARKAPSGMPHSKALALAGMSLHTRTMDAIWRGQQVRYEDGRCGLVLDLDCQGERAIIQRLDVREGERAMVTVPLETLGRELLKTLARCEFLKMGRELLKGSHPSPDGYRISRLK